MCGLLNKRNILGIKTVCIMNDIDVNLKGKKYNCININFRKK